MRKGRSHPKDDTNPRQTGGRGGGSLNKGGGGKMYPHADYVSTNSAMGMPAEYTTADGRHLASDPLSDRDFINRPSVIVWPWQDITWGMQGGTNEISATPVSNWINNLAFNEIIMELQAARLINLSNVQLTNPVPAPVFGTAYSPSSFQYWLNLYTRACMVMRACESILAGVEFNYTTSLLANSVQQNLPQVDALCDLLKPIKVPQTLMDHIDRLSGLKTLTPSDPVALIGLPAVGGVAVDFTSPATLLLTINNAIQDATRLGQPGFNAGVAANFLSDFQLIKSYFALAYGNSGTWSKKGVSNNPTEYWQVYGSVSSFLQTTANLFYAWPSANATLGNMVPILCPKNMNPEDARYMLSTLGMSRYCTDVPGVITNVQAVNCFGLYQTTSTVAGATPTSFATYNQTGGVAISTESAAAAATTIFSNTELEVNFYLAYARANIATLGGAYNADRRSMRDLDVIKGRLSDLDAASIQYCKDIFIKPILGR